MRIMVGLGNPGSEYALTRHNLGFRVVEELAKRWRLAMHFVGASARVAQGIIAGEQIMLVEPQLYMNRSGTALLAVGPSFSNACSA